MHERAAATELRSEAAWRWGERALASRHNGGRRRTRESPMRKSWTFLVAVAALAASALDTRAQVTLRAVMHSDLKIVDPIWTTAYISRNHGYMIYDTLFAMD